VTSPAVRSVFGLPARDDRRTSSRRRRRERPRRSWRGRGKLRGASERVDQQAGDIGQAVPFGIGLRAVIGIERDDGGEEQVVGLALTPDQVVPRRAVADADIEQVEFRIVGHGVPHGPPAAQPPPFTAPRPGGHLQGRALEAVGGIAGHRIKPPRQRPGLRIPTM